MLIDNGSNTMLQSKIDDNYKSEIHDERLNETPSVSVRGLRKIFSRRSGEVVAAVDDLSIDIMQGEFIVLLGPSGCGKTTLLRLIAGLEAPDSGQIDIKGNTVFKHGHKKNTAPEHRPVGMVFQSYALWPHMSVLENVLYPLKNQKLSKSERNRYATETLEKVGIGPLAQQYPGQLSGGQQQRVALARAMASAEGLLLFDEQLCNIDAKVRDRLC